jgi:hypothetical protein
MFMGHLPGEGVLPRNLTPAGGSQPLHPQMLALVSPNLCTKWPVNAGMTTGIRTASLLAAACSIVSVDYGSHPYLVPPLDV